MKAIIITMVAVALTGCMTAPKQESTDARYERKERMMKCVGDFLVQDVAPSDGLAICTTIFSRYEPSIKQTTLSPVKAGGDK